MRRVVFILSILTLFVNGCKPKTVSANLTSSLQSENNFSLKLLDFPIIKDSADFISSLKQTYNLNF